MKKTSPKISLAKPAKRGRPKASPKAISKGSLKKAGAQASSSRFGIKQFLKSVRSSKPPTDVWSVIEKSLTYSMRERERERRWRIFFRLVYLGLFVFIILSVTKCRQTELNLSDYKNLSPIRGEHLALIRMNGIVASSGGLAGTINYKSMNDSLRRAFGTNNAKAVFISISSPGGSPVHSGRIYDEIMRLKTAYPNKKIYTVVDELAASAAYHIASATDEIYADDSSLVGSIGIISGGFGFEEAIEKLGLERRLYTSGENKAFLDPFAPVNPAQETFWQEIMDILYDNFIEDVQRGRGDRISSDRSAEVFSGYLYDGESAVQLGLIDGLGTLRSVAREKTDMENFIDYSPKLDYWGRVLEGMADQLAGSFLERVLRPGLQ